MLTVISKEFESLSTWFAESRERGIGQILRQLGSAESASTEMKVNIVGVNIAL